MITFNTLTDVQYQSARLSLLLLTEGAVNTPYVDTKGIPTIGIGFNLQDRTIFDLVMGAIAPTLTAAERNTLFDSLQGTFASTSALIKSINATLASFNDPNAPKSLAFSSSAQMLDTLNTAVQVYETRVNNWLAGIPESSERAVLISMAYNGLINSGTSPTLRQDILDGNRADAWYQIRYQSNGGASASQGIANRRYVEATQFGLYTNSSNPSQTEALQAAQEFTDHKKTIISYESTYSPAVAASTKGVAVPDIYKALAPAISTLETEYHIPSPVLLNEVQAVTTATPSLMGDEKNNLLIGLNADDTLTGGSGNDYVVGNGGNDKIDGGDGVDTALYSGNPIDYDIIHNTDGSWTVSNVRGSGTDGADTLRNVEYVRFADGTQYALRQNGVLDQTDFSFVVDTTGSMGPYLSGVQSDITNLINDVFGNGKTDAHISVVSFKDPQAGYPDEVTLPFTTQVTLGDRQSAAIAAINSLSASGGGDIPEGDNSGLLLALDGSAGQWRDSAAVRRIALFTDAPVKDTDLAATVSEYAHNLGVTITSFATASLAPAVQVSTFSLAGPASATASSSSVASSFQVQIYTIQVGSDSSATASIEAIATANNGQFFTAPTPADLVAALTKAIVIPQINGTAGGQSVQDNATIEPFAGVTLVDPTAGAADTVTVTLSSTANGTFSNLGTGSVDAVTGTYTVAGTADVVTAVLDALVFTPTPHQVAPGDTVTTSFTITDRSSSGSSASDGTTSVVATAAKGSVDDDTGEQAALKLTINNTDIGAAGASGVPFTVAGLDDEDIGTVTFTDAKGKTVKVEVNGGQTSYSADLSTLADGSIQSSLAVNTDPARNSFKPVAGNAVHLDQDAGEQAALSIMVGNIDVGRKETDAVPFTIGGLEARDFGSVIFTDANGKTLIVGVNGSGTSYSADLGTLADGPIKSSLVINTDEVGNSFKPVSGNTITFDPDKEREPPKLTITDHSLSLPSGGTISLPISVSPDDTDDTVRVKISGVPSFDTITAGDGHAVAKKGNSYTFTAADVQSGLTLYSSFDPEDHPDHDGREHDRDQGDHAAEQSKLSVTAVNTTHGEYAATTPQTITVSNIPPPSPNALSIGPSSAPESIDGYYVVFGALDGAGTSGDLVKIYYDLPSGPVLIGQDTVIGDRWELPGPIALPNNIPVTFTAREYDERGHEVSSASTSFGLGAHGNPMPPGEVNDPSELSITSPASGGSTRSHKPTISGTGLQPFPPPFQLNVEVKLDNADGTQTLLGTAPVINGEWSLANYSSTLPTGLNTITATESASPIAPFAYATESFAVEPAQSSSPHHPHTEHTRLTAGEGHKDEDTGPDYGSHKAALFNQFVAAGFHNEHDGVGQIISSPDKQGHQENLAFLSNLHH